MSEGRIVSEAREMARVRHQGQNRKANGLPYAEHVAQVSNVLRECGYDDEVLAAAFLHDTVEHTEVEMEEIRKRFGERVGGLVEAMTDDEAIESWEERKAEHRLRIERAGRDAAAIYGADKLAGVREARDGYADVEEQVEDRLGNPLDVRVQVWEADLRMLQRIDPPLGFLGELSSELAGLRGDRLEPSRY